MHFDRAINYLGLISQPRKHYYLQILFIDNIIWIIYLIDCVAFGASLFLRGLQEVGFYGVYQRIFATLEQGNGSRPFYV